MSKLNNVSKVVGKKISKLPVIRPFLNKRDNTSDENINANQELWQRIYRDEFLINSLQDELARAYKMHKEYETKIEQKMNDYAKMHKEYETKIEQKMNDYAKMQEEYATKIEQKMNDYVEMQEEYETRLERLGVLLNNSDIKQRFLKKTCNNQRINVVFLLEEPSVLKNILSVIDELSSDKCFNVILVNLWYKVYIKGEFAYYKRPNSEEVLNIKEYNFVEAYNAETESWIDLKIFAPDYVFFSRPYDYYREKSFHIQEVSRYARTCYIPYGIQLLGGDIEKSVLTTESAYLYYFFLDSALRKEYVDEKLKKTVFEINGHAVYLGYPGIDLLLQNQNIREKKKGFNILWLPRWTTSENNCHFFDYLKILLNYSKRDFVISITMRPHPLCFENFINNGELSEEQLETIKQEYSGKNRIDTSANYLKAFQESNVLVADETSLIAEYYFTDKPIVFCKKHTHFTNLMEKLVQGCYVVENENELIETLELLRKGEDILLEKRRAILEKYLCDYKNTAAYNIKLELLRDFMGENYDR